MRVSVFTEPHRGASYDDQLRFARLVEACGYEGFLRADHYQSMGADPGLPGPTDAWLTLAALARETSRIRLGTLVDVGHLPPARPARGDGRAGRPDERRPGRPGHRRRLVRARAHLVRHPVPAGRRALRPAGRAARGHHRAVARPRPARRYSFTGDHYRLVDAPALPKPVQVPGPPIIVGGRGPKRTPELAARYADEFNMPFKSVADTAEAFDRVREACERTGRTESGREPLVLSAGIVVAIGRTDAEAQRRAAPLHEKSALPPEDPVVGSPAQLAQRIGEFAAIGATRVHLRLIDFADLDHLELIAAEVLPQLDGER